MADAIYTILKPIISNKQYKYIRSHNTYQNLNSNFKVDTYGRY